MKLVYADEIRDLSKENRQILLFWKNAFAVDTEWIRKYEKEMLFQDGKKQIWIPVQSSLIPFFQEELKKGDDVILFLLWIAATSQDSQEFSNWLFAITEFQKPS